MEEVMGNYTRGILLESVAVGTLSAAGLLYLRVDHAILIGLATGAANTIPYLGPLVGGAAGFVVAFFQFQTLAMPLKVVALFCLVQFIDNWFFQPIILKKAVDLSPVITIFALFCGSQLAGFWGLLFGVPVACLIKETANVISQWYLAEKGRVTPSQSLATTATRPWVV